jgi:hypothetical protein
MRALSAGVTNGCAQPFAGSVDTPLHDERKASHVSDAPAVSVDQRSGREASRRRQHE